jgi:plasmid stability protein
VAKKTKKKTAKKATKAKTKPKGKAKPRASRAKPKEPKKQFPYRPEDDAALEQATRVAKARHYRSVKEEADEILKDIASQNDGEKPRDLVSDVDQRISETAESSVIYYHQALAVLDASDNWTEGWDTWVQESGSELPNEASAAITMLAFHAYRLDLQEAVNALDEDSYFKSDDDDDEDDEDEDD